MVLMRFMAETSPGRASWSSPARDDRRNVSSSPGSANGRSKGSWGGLETSQRLALSSVFKPPSPPTKAL